MVNVVICPLNFLSSYHRSLPHLRKYTRKRAARMNTHTHNEVEGHKTSFTCCFVCVGNFFSHCKGKLDFWGSYGVVFRKLNNKYTSSQRSCLLL
jgi:hypothetical protein